MRNRAGPFVGWVTSSLLVAAITGCSARQLPKPQTPRDAAPTTSARLECADEGPAGVGDALDAHREAMGSLSAERGISVSAEWVGREQLVAWAAAQPRPSAVLFFARIGDHHCVWVIDGTGVAVEGSTQATPAAISHAHHTLRQGLGVAGQTTARGLGRALDLYPTDGSPTEEATHPIAELAESLASMILPVEVRTALLRYEHVVVVPYGSLGTVPFAALPATTGGALVSDAYALSIAPSAEALLHASESSPGVLCPSASAGAATLASALVVGDPDSIGVPRLPGAATEATRAAHAFDVPLLTGTAATHEAISTAARSSRVIYIASHGVASPEAPLDGHLVLAEGDVWTAREIQETCLQDAQLAVLSACQTGLGATHRGGIIGLARAFHLAGVEQVVMSLWNADDAATADLMADFLDGLRQEHPPELALQRAMQRQRTRTPNPALWSAFTVFGVHDGRGLQLTEPP